MLHGRVKRTTVLPPSLLAFWMCHREERCPRRVFSNNRHANEFAALRVQSVQVGGIQKDSSRSRGRGRRRKESQGREGDAAGMWARFRLLFCRGHFIVSSSFSSRVADGVFDNKNEVLKKHNAQLELKINIQTSSVVRGSSSSSSSSRTSSFDFASKLQSDFVD